MWIIVIRALLSWVNPDPWNPIVRFLHQVTEPVLRPIRRRLPNTVDRLLAPRRHPRHLLPPVVPRPGSREDGLPARVRTRRLRRDSDAHDRDRHPPSSSSRCGSSGDSTPRRSTRSSRRWPTTSTSCPGRTRSSRSSWSIVEEKSRGVEGREKTLQETLVTTQKIAEEFKENSRREAELVLREAHLRAEKFMQDAREEHAKLTSRGQRAPAAPAAAGRGDHGHARRAQASRRAGAGGGRCRFLRPA